MKMVVGLGNPGQEYESSRHNAGFGVMDELARRKRVRFRRGWRAKAAVGRTQFGGEDVLLVKPLTYMNRSGKAITALMRRHGLEGKDLVVIVDDVELGLGRIRIRGKGSAGHHNGLKSVVEALGTEQFTRLRLGVGDKPDGGDLVEHVLSPMSEEEQKILNESLKTAADAVAVILVQGLTPAMNRFNQNVEAGRH